MTYREAMTKGETVLAQAGIVEAKTDAWLLLSHALKIDHTYYYMHSNEELSQEQLEEYLLLIQKRSERIPLQYITGEQEFMGLKFKVNSNVLVPRQDTETLVEQALKKVSPGMKILDLCTGSGCILISILKNAKQVTGFGYDISKQALAVAKENAKLNEVSAVFERSDLFDSITEKYDMIVSNPPYIPTEVIPTLMPEVAEFEPLIALDGDQDGLRFYRRIAAEAKDHLQGEGFLLLEIGADQGQEVSELLLKEGYTDVQVVQDLARLDRVVCGRYAILA